MSKYIPFACTNCLRTLNLRTAYLGRWVTCKHCENTFLARQVDGMTVSASSSEFPAIRTEEGGDRIASSLKAAFVQAFASPVPTRDGETRVSTLEDKWGGRAKAPAEAERLHDQVRAMQERLKAAEGLDGDLQSARDENARLDATARVLKSELAERVSEVERLRRSTEELVALRAERDRGEAQRRAVVAEVEQLRTCLDDVRRSHEADRVRLEAGRLEQATLHEEARRRWEAERHELLARWEDERRTSQEEERARTLTQQHLLIDQIEDARRRFEQDNRALNAEIERLGDSLRQARQQADLASRREGELAERLRVLQEDIDRRRLEAAAEPDSAREQLDALHHELEARFRQELTVERDRSAAEIDALHLEIDQLQAERDRHADGWSQAVASLEAVEHQHRNEIHALGLELQEARHREDRANQREAELIGEVQVLGAEHDRLRRDIEAGRQRRRDHCDTLNLEREARFDERRAAGLVRNHGDLGAEHAKNSSSSASDPIDG